MTLSSFSSGLQCGLIQLIFHLILVLRVQWAGVAFARRAARFFHRCLATLSRRHIYRNCICILFKLHFVYEMVRYTWYGPIWPLQNSTHNFCPNYVFVPPSYFVVIVVIVTVRTVGFVSFRSFPLGILVAATSPPVPSSGD